MNSNSNSIECSLHPVKMKLKIQLASFFYIHDLFFAQCAFMILTLYFFIGVCVCVLTTTWKKVYILWICLHINLKITFIYSWNKTNYIHNLLVINYKWKLIELLCAEINLLFIKFYALVKTSTAWTFSCQFNNFSFF